MKLKNVFWAVPVVTLAGFTLDAQAGLIRSTGKEITKGTARVASAAANGGQGAARGIAAVGRTTRGAVKTGAVDVLGGPKRHLPPREAPPKPQPEESARRSGEGWMARDEVLVAGASLTRLRLTVKAK